jgi:hypothetical protein
MNTIDANSADGLPSPDELATAAELRRPSRKLEARGFETDPDLRPHIDELNWN